MKDKNTPRAPNQSVTTVTIKTRLAEAATRYVADFDDPIWYNTTDLVNDLLERFLFERGYFEKS